MEHTRALLSVPLASLVASSFDVRRLTSGQIEELVAQIGAEGLLHNLVVTEQVVWRARKVKFAVAAGERRRRALLLQQQGRLPIGHEVPCELVPAERALEVCVAEYSGREVWLNAFLGGSDAALEANLLASTVEIDMAEWWEPTPARYLNHVAKSLIVAALQEAGAGFADGGVEALKKEELVACGSARLAGRRWVPLPLRRASVSCVRGGGWTRPQPWTRNAMWLLIAREPAPDAPYWPGRRLLAAVDAVAWSLLWVLLSCHAPKPVGVVSPFIAAVALLCGVTRLHRALWANHRYRFATWRWGRVVATLLMIGAMMKLMLPA